MSLADMPEHVLERIISFVAESDADRAAAEAEAEAEAAAADASVPVPLSEYREWATFNVHEWGLKRLKKNTVPYMDAQMRRCIAGPGVDAANLLSRGENTNLAKLIIAAKQYEAEHAAEAEHSRRLRIHFLRAAQPPENPTPPPPPPVFRRLRIGCLHTQPPIGFEEFSPLSCMRTA